MADDGLPVMELCAEDFNRVMVDCDVAGEFYALLARIPHEAGLLDLEAWALRHGVRYVT